MTLSSRDLRLEKRTLFRCDDHHDTALYQVHVDSCDDCVRSPFRLDLVPINRSVGLKAKPTKPVAEVLRPVVAKYGLLLPELVVKIVSCVGLECHRVEYQGYNYSSSPVGFI